MKIKQGDACTWDNDQGLAVVNSSITVHTVINVGSSQEAITIPSPHHPRAGMFKQSFLRMIFSSHTLHKGDLSEPAVECKSFQKSLCFLHKQ